MHSAHPRAPPIQHRTLVNRRNAPHHPQISPTWTQQWRMVGQQWRMVGQQWRMAGLQWRMVGQQWRMVGRLLSLFISRCYDAIWQSLLFIVVLVTTFRTALPHVSIMVHVAARKLNGVRTAIGGCHGGCGRTNYPAPRSERCATTTVAPTDDRPYTNQH